MKTASRKYERSSSDSCIGIVSLAHKQGAFCTVESSGENDVLTAPKPTTFGLFTNTSWLLSVSSNL